MVPRPTITPSAPVAARQRWASSGLFTSPLAISGIVSSRFTAAMVAQSAWPLNPCSRVRPCRVSSWAPAS